MKTRKISMLVAIGMSIFFASPAITSFATGINQSANQTIKKIGIVDFSQLSYTDIMSQGTWYSNRLGALNNGTSITIIGENSNWYEIDYNGGTAWIPKSRVNVSESATANFQQSKVVNKRGTVEFNLGYTDVTSEGTWYSNVVGTLNNGDSINIIGENSNWYEIDYNGGTAWIPKSRVSFNPIQTINKKGTVEFNLGYTDVTSEATWYSNVLGTLYNGTNVNIIGETAKWYEIDYNGGTAWIPKARVSFNPIQTINKKGTVEFNLGYTDVTSEGTWYSNVLGTLYNGDSINIIGETANWYEIDYNDGTAWIPKSRVSFNPIQTMNATETVDFNQLGYTDVTSEGTWDSDVMGTLNNGTSVNIIGEQGNWYEIDYNGGTAWIPKARVTTQANWSAQQNADMQQKIQDIISYGEGFIGTPYVWGGESPSGFDCSGLMQYIFANYGVNLPRIASEQQQCGTPVAQGNLQPGDLVFWGEPAYHVALYIGNGQILAAPHPGTTVTTMPLYPYTNARRIL